MEDFYYHGIWRMDWGLGNPNKTAALISMLMVGIWVLSYAFKRGFWLALVPFTVLGFGLVHTFSRGGMIALVVGLVPILCFAPKPFGRSRIAGICISVLALFIYSTYLGAHNRYEQGLESEDRSITNRLQIWKVAPEMMVDAPWGWGLGESGKAYMQWYQLTDRSEKYRTLVNSHLTWLVEICWPLRFLYLLAWLAVLTLCWPSQRMRINSISLGIWLALGVSEIFSSVGESLWIWVLPVLCLSLTLFVRFYLRIWPFKPLLVLALPAACICTIALFVLGLNGPHIKSLGYGVILGEGNPHVWIIIDKKVMGNNYGHTLRAYLNSSFLDKMPLGIIENPSSAVVPADSSVVLAGSASFSLVPNKSKISVQKIVLLNPYFLPVEMGFQTGLKQDTDIYFGEYCQSPTTFAWESAGRIHRVDGLGNYLPNWPKLALSQIL